MLRLTACTAGCAVAAALMATPLSAPAQPDNVAVDGDCTVIRQLPNGRQIVTPAPRRRGHGSHSSAAVSSSGVSASSTGGASVSVSSSSRGGRGSAVASSSSGGRTVTTTHDGDGCTVVIDDRGRRGGRR